MKVEFYRHSLGNREIESLKKVIQGVFLTSGPGTRELEEKLAAFLGCRHFLAVSSCTAGLFLCLRAMGIGPGDEVITTPMTFIATSNSIMEAGATPVFVDVEPETGNMDPELIKAAITPRTRAIMPVHLYGQMADMVRIRQIADRHGLFVIEDAAHCLEGTRDNIRPGQLGHAACFSFYATKNITSGEGGGIAVNDPDLARRLKFIRTHGMSREAADRYQGRYEHWDMVCMGYKANFDDIRAAVLLPQLPDMEKNLVRRQELALLYQQGLAHVRGVDFHAHLPGVVHARHLFPILVDPDKRDSCLMLLQKNEVGVAVNYRAVHLLSFYREKFGYARGMFPAAESIGDRTISLPLYPLLKNEEASYVIETLKNIL